MGIHPSSSPVRRPRPVKVGRASESVVPDPGAPAPAPAPLATTLPMMPILPMKRCCGRPRRRRPIPSGVVAIVFGLMLCIPNKRQRLASAVVAAFSVSSSTTPSSTSAAAIGGTVVSKFLASIPVRRVNDDDDDPTAVQPGPHSSSSEVITANYGGSVDDKVGRRNEVRGRRGNNGGGDTSNMNPADDPAFLRKRTASLLAINNDGPENSSSSSSDSDANSNNPTSKGFRPDKKTFHFLMDAWAFSAEKDAADMAVALLNQMETLDGIDPDVRSYTKAMNAVARSNRSDAGETASTIFRQMVFASSTRGISVHPNTHSYTAIIEAYANSDNNPDQADKWCREMVRTFRKGDESVIPTSRAFHAVLSAYARSGQPESGRKAQDLMELLEELWNAHRLDETKPTRYNYHALINAWANSPEPGSAHHARRVLQRMEERFVAGDVDLKPTTITYNTVIDAYAKDAEKRTAAADDDNFEDASASSTISFTSDSDDDKGPETHAEELLRRMEQLYSTGENVDARPNVRSFNSVLNVWAKSGRAEGADRAQEILGVMEKLYQQGNDEVRPDVHSFCTVINAWARSPAPNKADRALNLFREMKSLYRSGNHEHLKPNVVAYNAVLNACAFCSGEMGGLSQSSHAMEMAHAILKEIEGTSNRNNNNEFGVKPDQITYGTFLKVCANHLPDCSTRQQIVEMVFQKCQREGLVGNLVLQQLKAMVPDPDLYQRLVGRPQYAETTMKDLPPSWWCNVVEGKGWRRQRPWS